MHWHAHFHCKPIHIQYFSGMITVDTFKLSNYSRQAVSTSNSRGTTANVDCQYHHSNLAFLVPWKPPPYHPSAFLSSAVATLQFSNSCDATIRRSGTEQRRSGIEPVVMDDDGNMMMMTTTTTTTILLSWWWQGWEKLGNDCKDDVKIRTCREQIKSNHISYNGFFINFARHCVNVQLEYMKGLNQV